MPDNTPLKDELDKARASNGRPRTVNPEDAKARNIAMAKAAALAASVLKHRHKEEYDNLYQKAKKEVGL